MDEDSDYEFEGDYDNAEEALIDDFKIPSSEELETLDNNTLAEYLIQDSVPEVMLACLENENNVSNTASGRLALQELKEYIEGKKTTETLEDDEYQDDDDEESEDDEESDDELEIEDITDKPDWRSLLMKMSVKELRQKGLTKISVLTDYIEDQTGQIPDKNELKLFLKNELPRKFGTSKLMTPSVSKMKTGFIGGLKYGKPLFPNLSNIKRDYVGPGGGVARYGRKPSNQENAAIVMRHFQKTRKVKPNYTLKDAWDDFKDGKLKRSKRKKGRSGKKTVRRRSKKMKRKNSMSKTKRTRRRSKPIEYGPTYNWIDTSYKIF